MQTTRYDLFISYSNADRAWVEGYLLDALDQSGIHYHSEAAFALGTVKLLEFERAIQQSQRTLLVVSPAYLANGVNEFIAVLTQAYGLDTATWPVIPLILQPIQLPPRLSILVKLNATNEEEQQEAIKRLCADLQRPVPAESPKLPCPYPGMIPFSEDESERFFGRDQVVQECLECLRLNPFLTVIGPSGSGKSSLVFAGIIPALHQSGFWGAGKWLIRAIRPGETPLTTLKTTLGGNLANLAQSVTQVLSTSPDAQRLLLVLDQFEEVFTLAGEEAIPFQETLLRLVKIPNCYVILTVRADFYADLMESPLWRQIQSHRLEVLPLDEAGLRQAIIKPAENVDVLVEPALVDRLVVDAAGEPGILPLIQETLVLLWERVERRFLPLRAYEALILPRSAYGLTSGNQRTGLEIAIARRADAAIADLCEKQQEVIARRIFLRLVQFGEGRADTRRQQSVDALRVVSDDPRLFDQTLRHLADSRILTLSGDENTNRKVDIAHEALIRGWPALQQWLTERREAEQTRRRLATKAEEWIRLGRDSGGLLDEVELAEAQRWLESSDAADLGYDEVLPALVQISEQAIQEAKQQEEKTRLRELEQERKLRKAAQMTTVGAGIAGVILLSLASFAGFQLHAKNVAEQQKTTEIIKSAWNSLGEVKLDECNTTLGKQGIRSLYCNVKRFIDYKRLKELSGLPVFIKGPHSNYSLNFQSQDFGYYNKDFVLWLRENFIPAVQDKEFKDQSQELYNINLKNTARVFYVTHEVLTANPTVFQQEKTFYLQLIMNRTLPDSYIEQRFGNLSNYLQDLGYKAQDTYPYTTNSAFGFWMRRSIDGTEEEFFRLLEELMNTYDAQFLKYIIDCKNKLSNPSHFSCINPNF